MTDEQLIRLAEEMGFAAAAVVDTADIPFDGSFRAYCAENLCGKYGVNYSCPPDCGTVEQMRQRILDRRRALVLQTIWQIEDLTDQRAIKEAKKTHNAMSLRLMKQLREEGCDGFMVGASGCALCERCAIVDGEPCRFPDRQYSCMSAYCVFVKKLTDLCGIEYDCGPGLLAFFGMYVCD